MDERLKKRIIRDKARCAIRKIIKGQIYTWPPSVDKAEFKLMVAQGTSQQEIGKRFGKTQPQISRLMRQLTPKDLYEIVMTRPPAVTMPVKVKSLGPTDIVEEVMGVLDKLKEIRAFLEEEEKKPQEERIFKRPDQRLFYMLGTLDRILRWAETFMNLRKQMAEMIGFEVWRKEFLSLLDDVAPDVKVKLMQRIQEKLFVRQAVKVIDDGPARTG